MVFHSQLIYFRSGAANIKGMVTLMGDNICEAVSSLHHYANPFSP